MSSSKKLIKQKSNNIKVIVRCRPLLQFQNQPAWQISSSNKIECMQTKSVKLKFDKENRRSETQLLAKFKEMSFQFQKVYQDKSTSQQIYKQQTRQIVQESLKTNKNLTLMCYGQTCSGKTFTILGQQKFPGLMPCLLRDLMIYKRQKSQTCSVNMSYFEIYNQSIYDLLTEGKKNINGKLKIYEDKKYGWQVAGLKVQRVQTFDDCIKIIEKGEKNRSYASKQNHDRSSRSHTIMRIYIEKQDQKYNKTQQIFNILDLAGSQRLSQFSKNPQQTASINKSLFQLSNVISKLSANDQGAHIPFRDSKLTKLMQSSLKGNGKCVIVFCISPAVESFNQTLTTLRLAKKAKIIQVSNEQQDLTQNWSPLQKQLFETKQKLAKKQAQCQQLEYRLNYLSNQLQRLENYVDEIQNNRCQVKLDLTILCDYENFVMKDLSNNSIFSSMDIQLGTNKKLHNQLQTCKNQMKQSLQELYQNYVQDIIGLYVNIQNSKKNNPNLQNNNFAIQIQQLNLQNLIFNYDLQRQIKLNTVQNYIHGLQNSKQNFKNDKYTQLLELAKQYRLNLSNQVHQNNQNPSNSSLHFPKTSRSMILNLRQKQKSSKIIKQIDSKIQIAQCKTLYSWGCSKDGRLLKGNQVLPGINSLTNQSYGTIKKIVTSFNHNLFLNAQGKVFGWGKNNFNQISSKDTPSYSLPRQINIKQKIISIATGWGHSLALSESKKAYSWGYGENGQLGHGNLSNISKLKLIQSQNLFIEVYAGHSHSALLDEKRQLYTFGFNKDYRCMIKSKEQFISQPTKLSIGNIKSASLGVSHSAIITKDNNLFCGGVGTNGQFGRQLSLQIEGCEFLEVESRKFQNQQDKYEKICPLIQFQFQSQFDQSIIEIKCTENTTYLLTDLGNLYMCGKNFNRKNSLNIYHPKLILQNVQNFTANSRHGFAFSHDNKIYAWGFNMYNQLGNNKESDLNMPEIVPGLSSLKLSKIQCGFIHTIALGM